MVKKFIYSVFALIALSSVTNASAQEAQEKKNEMQFGAGVGAVYIGEENFGKFYDGVKDDPENTIPYAHVTAQYMHNFNKRWGLGVEANVGCGWTTIEQDKEDIGHKSHFDASAMLVGRYYWLHKDHFGLYSKVGIGAEGYGNYISLDDDYQKKNNISDDDLKGDEGIRLTAKVSPVGVDFGGKRVKAFVETGFSRQVTLTGGVKFNF